jgi:hypothetical protein
MAAVSCAVSPSLFFFVVHRPFHRSASGIPAEVTVFNDHDLSSAQNFIAIHSPSSSSSTSSTTVDQLHTLNHRVSTIWQSPTIVLEGGCCCALCWQISRVYTVLPTTDQVAYHMIMK